MPIFEADLCFGAPFGAVHTASEAKAYVPHVQLLECFENFRKVSLIDKSFVKMSANVCVVGTWFVGLWVPILFFAGGHKVVWHLSPRFQGFSIVIASQYLLGVRRTRLTQEKSHVQLAVHRCRQAADSAANVLPTTL